LSLESLENGTGKEIGLFGAAERLFFNIGRIPVKQSRQADLRGGPTANLAAGQEKRARDASLAYSTCW
jgi:hypothetical protein